MNPFLLLPDGSTIRKDSVESILAYTDRTQQEYGVEVRTSSGPHYLTYNFYPKQEEILANLRSQLLSETTEEMVLLSAGWERMIPGVQYLLSSGGHASLTGEGKAFIHKSQLFSKDA